MVHGTGVNRSQRIVQLLEGKSTFIINVHAMDSTAALEKIISNRKDYKDADLLLQKSEVIRFYDKLRRPLGQLIDVIHTIIDRDPRIRNASGDDAGVMEISPGDWIFFGCGRT
jgi:hypothetical protein